MGLIREYKNARSIAAVQIIDSIARGVPASTRWDYELEMKEWIAEGKTEELRERRRRIAQKIAPMMKARYDEADKDPVKLHKFVDLIWRWGKDFTIEYEDDDAN